MGRRQRLSSGWTVRPVGVGEGPVPEAVAARTKDGLPAAVPGCVHTDLLACELIPDPYLDHNEDDVQWIGRTNWRYETTFAFEPEAGQRVDLVFEGLDTVATVELNGAHVAATYNMHRTYRFAVTDQLRAGQNHLVVSFGSALEFAETQQDARGYLPVPNPASIHPINYIRKMACNFGWDWGPVLVTAGIWRPVELHAWSTARLERVRPSVTVERGQGRVRLDIDVERQGERAPLRVTARIAGVEECAVIAADAAVVSLDLGVAEPQLWWPHGYGDQPLYELEVELEVDEAVTGEQPGDVLDRWSQRVGFRTVELDTSADDVGTAFTFVVNGVPIFARGANWIPDDCFPTRVGADCYRTRIGQAKTANVNMLRVWGGGIYESDDFYRACDEAGMLVWQDFLFACAAYPEESPYREEVEAEARDNVLRLMPRPSLVLWNGNNENYMGWHEWGWSEIVGDRSWGHGYYTDLLPRVVGDVDPTRPYWPGSPYSGDIDLPVSLDGYGCKHVWDVWNTHDYPVYRRYVPRFVSEFGWQAPPTWATLTRSVHDSPLRPDSPGVLHHQKASDGNGKLARGLAHHFPDPQIVEDWHFLTQLNQARAVALGIEHFRSHRGTCMGTIVWQLNDCWPVTSWAAVDGDGRLKPLWYALRRVYAERLLTIQPRPEGLHLFLVNEGTQPWRTDVSVRCYDLEGALLDEWSSLMTVNPGSVGGEAIPAHMAAVDDAKNRVLVADASGQRATWFFAEDKDLAYSPPAFDVQVTARGGSHVVRVTAHTLLRDLSLFADRLRPDATVDSMLVTMLPGETHDFHVDGLSSLTEDQIDRYVLRCANEAVLRARGSVSSARAL